jgi:hypothetical protein
VTEIQSCVVILFQQHLVDLNFVLRTVCWTLFVVRKSKITRYHDVSETICFRPQVKGEGDTYSVGSIRWCYFSPPPSLTLTSYFRCAPKSRPVCSLVVMTPAASLSSSEEIAKGSEVHRRWNTQVRVGSVHTPTTHDIIH